MLRIAQTLTRQLTDAIDRAYPTAADRARNEGSPLDPQLVPASKPEFGDFQANGALALAKRLAVAPRAIATAVVARLEGSGVRLVDTRKTTPGLRLLEKYAVRCCGGHNHRLGLDDAAMLKENHLVWAGGLESALAAVRASAPWPARVTVEAESALEAEAAVRAGADGV